MTDRRYCEWKVSTSVSRIVGKRECSLTPRVQVGGKWYCLRHERDAKAAAYTRLVTLARQWAEQPAGGSARKLLKDIGE